MDTKKNGELNLPIIYLNGEIILPKISLQINIKNTQTLKAIKHAHSNNDLIVIKADYSQDISKGKINSVLCKIEDIKIIQDSSAYITFLGLHRASIIKTHSEDDLTFAQIDIIHSENDINKDSRIYKNIIINTIKQFNTKADIDFSSFDLIYDTDTEFFIDLITSQFIGNNESKIKILIQHSLSERIKILSNEIIIQSEFLAIERAIEERVKKQIDKNQKEYYLNEKIKSIQTELGNSSANEIESLKQKAKDLPLNSEAFEKVTKEINRLSQIPSGSPELTISRTYIESILEMPWGKFTKDELDINNAKNILDKRHYGLDKVKERIIEFIAVLNKKNNLKGPILCFVGPPGVGKTSIVRAIAESLGRKFVQVSLGGVRDEAEIRGHRRTYVSAIPGRIISGIKQAGTMNPLFLFDEIDKMSSDFRGDPAAALLEVLDSEQNSMFRDHYLDIPFDLSNVMFITTANSMDTIPAPLLDRLEIIEVSSYTPSEKVRIASKHLFEKQCNEHGIKSSSIKISDKILYSIIEQYTRESGVRQLERVIAKIIRKSIVEMDNENKKTLTINENRISRFLGKPKYKNDSIDTKNEVGLVNGLAYTPYGGVILNIECLAVPGDGKIYLTGKLGDVMKESANAALTWVKYNANKYNISNDDFNKFDIHIHVPEGAVPKDGPSAGVTITIAIVSALSNKKVNSSYAMTGEITLRGNVLAIGGLREKLFAAYRNHIKNVFIPNDNIIDLDEIPSEIKDTINIIPVNNVIEILDKVIIQ